MISVRVYGRLRKYIGESKTPGKGLLEISPGPDDTIKSLLKGIKIPENEVYSIFYNSKLLSTRTQMARWLGYPQERDDPFDWNLELPVKAGDRIGLFGRDMSALVV